ncbi:hypothetical protein [Antrihabitans cavernicola]|uniref:Lipoprotein n=1 Tax=Antrihabitans cavernicola TaxID=2495913 RepID=A0A5A7SE17_9NOCA|nr:hypothetical protein [Spelaeibacter cavernicola]KAA0023619.1 hypothetical protein FOY51_09545 [Spelaeibacter cavernicola]
MRLRALQQVMIAAGVASLLVTGCSSSSDGSSLQTIAAATAVQSPAVTVAPAGTVQQVGAPVDAMAFDADSRILAALADRGTKLVLIDRRGTDAPTREVPLGGSGVTVSLGKPGEVLVPFDRGVARVDLRSGKVDVVKTSSPARSAQVLSDNRLAAGLANGTIEILGTDGTSSTISGLASVDGLAVTGNSITALDRRQTSLTELNVADSSLGLSLRAGQGASDMTTDHFGRILVTDTPGNALMVFTADPLVLRQQGPVGPGPYAVTYDDRAEIAWVTLTGSNEVVGYDLAEGIPKEVRRFPTVRQPDSVAVDSATGDVFVGSATGDGVQRIATVGAIVGAEAPAQPSQGGR